MYNVHSLVHLKNDACKYGSLEKCSAWKFENYMQHLKRKVRCGNNPAVQLVKRVYEEMVFDGTTTRSELKIYNKEPNNAYKTSVSGKFCEVLYADSEETWMCRLYHSQAPQFIHPCDSRIIGTTRFHHLNYEMKSLKKDVITARCMMVRQGKYVVFMHLLHET